MAEGRGKPGGPWAAWGFDQQCFDLVAGTHLDMRSRRSDEERRLVQRTNDLVAIFVELFIYVQGEQCELKAGSWMPCKSKEG